MSLWRLKAKGVCPDVPLGAQNFQSEPDVSDEDELETDASSASDSAVGSVKTKLKIEAALKTKELENHGRIRRLKEQYVQKHRQEYLEDITNY